jgi:hypothetical protein
MNVCEITWINVNVFASVQENVQYMLKYLLREYTLTYLCRYVAYFGNKLTYVLQRALYVNVSTDTYCIR